jgi:2-dehydro-3-deoxyphosphogluconate aldolase/(4S)-4-hydroxy-2-oxoglutarate aldolase
MPDKTAILATIENHGLLAMLRMPSADDALEMAEALIEAGIRCIQVPMTVPGAIEVIIELRASHGDRAAIGAGTVLDAKAADGCIKAGAQFVVSPLLSLPTIQLCQEAGIAVIAGALTPTEIHAAHAAGADMIRIFPCAALGGANYLRFIRAPLPAIPLLPAGGVSLQTAADYISAGATALEVDVDLVDLDALHGGRKADIITNAHLYLDVAEQARALSTR